MNGAHLPSLSRVATSMRTNTSSPMIAVRIRESVGFAVLSAAITRARHERDALVVRIGVEAAGHYPRTLVARLQAAGLEVAELNPRAVKDARGQQLLRTLKSDARDCGDGRTVDPR